MYEINQKNLKLKFVRNKNDKKSKNISFLFWKILVRNDFKLYKKTSQNVTGELVFTFKWINFI